MPTPSATSSNFSSARSPVAGLEAVRACAEARPQAQFAIGPVKPATERAIAIEEAVAGLDDELGALENGRYLPQPIAVALRALDDMTQARAKFVLELGETVIQWLALCTAADLLATTDAPKTVGALKRNLAGGVSMGRWHELLVTAVKESTDVETTHAAVWRTCFGDKSKRSELFTYFASLVEARNAFAHGATASDEHVARKIVDEHAPRLRELLKAMLRPALALIPAEVELLGFEGDLQSYRMTRLIGDGMPAAVPMYSRRRMNGGLWLCDAFADRALPLEPFFIRDTCPKCGARELFLLTRLDQLEFRSPATGHVLATSLDERPFSTEARECLDMLTARVA